LTNFQVEGVSIYKVNSEQANVSYTQAFPTGSSLEVNWNNARQTSNGVYDYFSPELYSKVRLLVEQPLLAGFGTGPEPALSAHRQNQSEGLRHRLPRPDHRHRHADLQYVLGPGERLR
jgi:hypothetical protein